jgi:hypothetical protein
VNYEPRKAKDVQMRAFETSSAKKSTVFPNLFSDQWDFTVNDIFHHMVVNEFFPFLESVH